MAALWLAALCAFTANYVAMPLTETPSIFCVALGLCAFAAVSSAALGWMLALAFAWSCPALLRPDGALLAVLFFPALIFYGRSSPPKSAPCRLVLRVSRRTAIRRYGPCVTGAPSVSFSRGSAFCRGTSSTQSPRAPALNESLDGRLRLHLEISWNVPGNNLDIHALPTRALIGTGGGNARSARAVQRGRPAHCADRLWLCLACRGTSPRPSGPLLLTLPLLRLADMWLRPRFECSISDCAGGDLAGMARRPALPMPTGRWTCLSVAGAGWSLLLAQAYHPAAGLYSKPQPAAFYAGGA